MNIKHTLLAYAVIVGIASLFGGIDFRVKTKRININLFQVTALIAAIIGIGIKG